MPLDRYVNIVTSMINDGRFSHIGHGVLRLEGQTAWGVWLRINHWDSSQGRRARLRVSIPRRKPHSDFPWVSAPSFPGLDVCHFGFPSFSFSVGRATTSSARPTCAIPSAPRSLRTTTSMPRNTTTCPSPSTAPILPTLALLTGAKVARSSSRSSDDSLHRMAPEPTPSRAVLAISLHLPTLPLRHLPLPSGFALVVAVLLLHPRSAPRDTVTLTVTVTGPQHRPSVPQPPVGSSRPARPPRTCRASGCSSPPHSTCSVGFCSTHCTSRRCQRRSPPPVQPRCRRPDLNQLHLIVLWVSATCIARAPIAWCMILSPVGKQPGGGSPMNDGAVTSTPLVQSLGLGQLNCRRLWRCDGSIHDGFMGLVSCLDQLDLQVSVCKKLSLLL